MAKALSNPKADAVRRKVGRKVVRGKISPNDIKDTNLLVRLNRISKALVQRAAASRGLSISDYLRIRIVTMARQDIADDDAGVLRLSRKDQIAFWKALQNPPALTPALRRLGALVRRVM